MKLILDEKNQDGSPMGEPFEFEVSDASLLYWLERALKENLVVLDIIEDKIEPRCDF